MTQTEELAAEADATARAAREGLEWLQRPANAELVGDRLEVTRKVLHRGLTAAQRLAGTARRPMAVAVFGASQAGKSHLIATLAKTGDSLLVKFNGLDQPMNYIKQINQDKGTESTGVVTRFSTKPTETPPGFPVHLKLLSHSDIIKIIVNAYVFDGRPKDGPTVEEVGRHLASFRGAMPNGDARNGLGEEDVWDIEEYFARYLGNAPATQPLADAGFWEFAAQAASSMPLETIGQLFSIAWGGYNLLTDLYLKLARGLQQVGFAAEAFVPVRAIDLAENLAGKDVFSILEVGGLERINDPSPARIEMRTPSGIHADLPRSVVSALTAEVHLCMVDKPWPFFESTDLLDFPGYRSRGLKDSSTTSDIDGPTLLKRKLQSDPSATLKELILRGKVEYLFQRYVADQEITAMLLCVKENNQDVTDLAAVISRWVGLANGETPADRSGKPPLLFYILTRFDLTAFEEKASDESLGLAARFEGRMLASLLSLFGAPDSWVNNWSDGRPFNNLFLMRNPGIKNAAVFDHDGPRESGIRAERVEWIARLRDSFLSVDMVQKHFADPSAAFDEVMRLNDGGATRIARNLTPICRPDVKPAQVREALKTLRRRLAEALNPYYRSSDVEQRLGERRGVADRVIADLAASDSAGRMGSVLRGFMIENAGMSDYLQRGDIAELPETAEAAPAVPPAGSRGVLPGQAARPLAAAVLPGAPRPAARVSAPHQRFAALAVKAWIASAFERANDAHFAHDVLVSTDNLVEIATEVSGAAARLKLGSQIAAAIERHAFGDERRDRQREKAAIVATRIINRFIADLGMAERPEADRPHVPDPDGGQARAIFQARPVAYDASGISREPVAYQAMAAYDWLYAFYRTVEDNALHEDGYNVDPRENAALGEILRALTADIR